MCAAQHSTIPRSTGAKTCVSRLKRAGPCAHHQSLVLYLKSATGETGLANDVFLTKTVRSARFATVTQRVEVARRCLRHETSGAAGHARKDCQNRLSLGRQGIGGRWHIPCEIAPREIDEARPAAIRVALRTIRNGNRGGPRGGTQRFAAATLYCGSKYEGTIKVCRRTAVPALVPKHLKQ